MLRFKEVLTPPDAPAPPAPLGRAGGYDLLLELAAGGMATVYLARAVERDVIAAVKRPHKHLASDQTFSSMLVDEARLASAIDHPNVVKVRELGFEGAVPFIVMDYVEGCSLSDLRKELGAVDRALDSRVAVRVILDALAGLQAAHELRDENGKHLGIIHRDISPHNVLVGVDGRARVTDFGIAKAEDRLQVTRTHEVKGKLAYLAPERVDRRRLCTRQSDIFSMAVVLWECLAGRRLFRGDEAIDTLQEVMKAPIPRLRQLGADIAPGLDDALAKALSRDLGVRYQTAEDFARALERGAGRGHIGSYEDVARVVEAVFGSRLAHRHDQVRKAVGDEKLHAVMARSQLRERPPPAGGLTPDSQLLAAIAPAAPSARYAFGALASGSTSRRPRWLVPVAVGAGVGLVAGVLVIAVMAGRSGPAPRAAGASGTPSSLASAPTGRPTATVAQPTPSDTGVEEAIDLGDVLSDASTPGARPHHVHKATRPIGTVRDGFTKLR